MGFTSSGVILGSGSGSFTPLYVKLVVSACSSPSFTFVGITFTFTLSSNASDCDQQCALLEQWHEFDKHVSPLLQMNRFEELLRRIKRVRGQARWELLGVIDVSRGQAANSTEGFSALAAAEPARDDNASSNTSRSGDRRFRGTDRLTPPRSLLQRSSAEPSGSRVGCHKSLGA